MKIVDYLMIGATIRIGREMLCLPYAGFFIKGNCSDQGGGDIYGQQSIFLAIVHSILMPCF